MTESIKFAELIRRLKSHKLSFICYEGAEVVPIKKLCEKALSDGVSDVGFYIGPEGGLSVSETELAKKEGVSLCGLGSRILRTETASGCVLSALMLMSDNL